VFNLEVEEGRYYGLPEWEVPGFKFGRYHHRGERGPAETVRREPDAEDERLLRAFAERYFPDGAGATMALRACLFTNTPDEHFVLDRTRSSRRWCWPRRARATATSSAP
jgi:sarcosine oxidase